jgi:hypothetical protein
MRKLKFTHNDIDALEMVIQIDDQKFNEQAKSINEFWAEDEYRVDIHGSHEKAALKMFVAECFQLVAFNNFLGASYVTDRFDWDKEGVEGFPSLPDMGIKILSLDSWHISADELHQTVIS